MKEKVKRLLELGMNIDSEGNLYYGSLKFSQDEIERHHIFSDLENKISDYMDGVFCGLL